MKTLAIVLGTRPEIIKLAPLIAQLRKASSFNVKIISSGQHASMADQAFRTFGLTPDRSLDLMKENQSPNSFLASLLPKLEDAFESFSPAAVIVQGDTSTALGGALAAFHAEIPVAHVEAGLRTDNIRSPFPEEMNRRLISTLSTFHFCHSEHAKRNLFAEGIRQNVFVVGNTVVDALAKILEEIEAGRMPISREVRAISEKHPSLILVTGHRRENFDGPLRNLCRVLKNVTRERNEVGVVYPVHLNPNVQEVVHEELGAEARIHLLGPLDYPSFVWLMKQSSLIVSDSGGIQEEAPSIGKHVLVTRANTERPEAVEAGWTEIFSLDKPDELQARICAFLGSVPTLRAPRANPYGDGNTATRISEILAREL